ncbi:MAG: amidase [Candidatus Cloacimonetes bacterium HGW-Cloacimonetes-3]|jgi:Asp-tRNA(Asn)/Glu-tRNA(Gln) amidotransferase A subunit family amidase|nr:MAG: amidase [Candidatus Cloacimonetes bacterium HGW-Cloacimonetes-3]
MENKFSNLSIEQLCNGLRNSNIKLSDYIVATMTHIDASDSSIHAFLPERNRKERLLEEAARLLEIYQDACNRPPLFGLLVGVKDLLNVDGMPTRAGSKLPAEAFVGNEAEVVTKLKQLGAIVLGKTVSTEFAYFSPGETSNPVNPLHTPGGSSSGSAAAVAAGYCHAALGTQTIASIIRPASYCGVYGFKPSWGRISTEGAFPFSQSADHVGIICRSMDDISFLSKYLLDKWKACDEQPKPRLGCVKGTYLMQASESVRENYKRTVDNYRHKGHEVVECDPFGDIEIINAKHRKLIAAEFTINHKALFEKYSYLYSEHSKQLFSEGLKVSRAELQELKQAQILLRDRIQVLMSDEGINLWITPSTTTTAPFGLNSTGSPLMSLPWTNAGMPSLTIPDSFDAGGLPFGLQIVGSYQQDEFCVSTRIFCH